MSAETTYMVAWWCVSGAGGALFAAGNNQRDIPLLIAGACLVAAGIFGNMY